MAPSSWANEATNRFFNGRVSPSQTLCDEIARSISGASTVSPVTSPGSMSYTVVCSGRPRSQQQELIVSFREPEATLKEKVVKLAKEIHGDLVPWSTCHGNIEGANPLLYFARCWLNPQPINHNTQGEQHEELRKKLVRLSEELHPSIPPYLKLSKLIESLPSLFSENYPQVLTHNDFSVTNILIDKSNFGVTGIVDWSLASILPFGMDLDILFLTTGFMTCDGWCDYECKPLLQNTFWDEFWVAIQALAEAAGRIGALIRLTFRRNPDGSPSDEVLVSESRMEQLRAWFGE
ncbi:hypothetical protein GGR51DRAFT_548158 [Nemania sp. FL0031]|nr:hypothetical protein GGR51DRAFT_548158 [Nemania sp. FL0031]